MVEEIKRFSKIFASLKSNDKGIINTLSLLATDSRDDVFLSKEIAKLAIMNIFKAPLNMKLTYFYVVDSIIKNVGSPYKEMFAEKIIDAFINTFESNKDYKVRVKLYKLRLTWKDYFDHDLMNDLDESVRKFDPAWPLVTQFKSKPKAIVINTTKSSPDSTTPHISRDPRIVKSAPIESKKKLKRKSEDPEDIEENLFLIDRDGDNHIGKSVNKKGRLDDTPSLCDGLFGTSDIDLRVTTKQWTSDDIFKMLKGGEVLCSSNSQIPPTTFASNSSIPPPTIASNSSIPPTTFASNPSIPPTAFASNSPIALPIPLASNLSTLPISFASNSPHSLPMPFTSNLPLTFHTAFASNSSLAPQAPFASNSSLAPQALFSPNSSIVPPTPFASIPPMALPNPLAVNLPLPAPREPIWTVRIDGFPQLPAIGTDPRLLAQCPFNGETRTITIDGRQFLLYLDRIQPCIFANNALHAVRFYSPDLINLHIDNVPFVILENGVTNIVINRRNYVACLGGPGHELILNGSPYNVRIDGNLHRINVDGVFVNMRFVVRQSVQVNVHLAIPSFVCEWASKGFFGSAQFLNTAPLNPLVNPNLQDAQAQLFRVQVGLGALEPIGIIATKKTIVADLVLDLTKYSFNTFAKRNDREIDDLHSGFQCELCGTRFLTKNSNEFKLHLDYHFFKNAASLSAGKKSRSYVGGSRQWILGGAYKMNSGPVLGAEETDDGDQRVWCPAFDDVALNKCGVCSDVFDQVWDDDEDSHMLPGAVLHNGKVYHSICLEDADKHLNESVNECDISQIELTDEPLRALERVLQGRSECVLLPDSCESEHVGTE